MSDEQKRKADSDRRARERRCAPNLPNLSVGDFNITPKSWDRVKKENEVMLIGVSDN